MLFYSETQSLTPSYKAKVDQFRRIFLGTPVDTDRLLVDYSCALSKNNHGLLLQGRMYVTENWICFYSKILQEQKIYLAVKEIVGITKAKTARVIPNAIQLIYSKNHQRFFFTSFASRERTYAILHKIWDNCRNHQSFLQNNQAMSTDEIVQHLRDIYGDDSLAILEDEDSECGAQIATRSLVSSDSGDDQSTSTDPPIIQAPHCDKWESADGMPMGNSTATTDDDDSLRSCVTDADSRQSTTIPDVVQHQTLLQRCSTPELRTATQLDPCGVHSANPLLLCDERKRRFRKRQKRNPHENGITSSSVSPPSPSPGLTSFPDESATCFPGHDHQGQMHVNTLIPLSVDALFKCIFTDSKFIHLLSESRGTFGMVQSSWPEISWPTGEYSDTNPPVTVERVINYKLNIKNLLLEHACDTVEQQTLLVSESRPNRCYVVDATVTNLGIKLCESFCVVNRYCLLRFDRLNSHLSVHSRIVYHKSVVFGLNKIIQRTCSSGLSGYFTAFLSLLTELASGLSDADRLTGGYLADPNTEPMTTNSNPACSTDTSKDRDVRVKRAPRDNHPVRVTSTTPSLPRSVPNTPMKLNATGPNVGLTVLNKIEHDPSLSKFGVVNQLVAFKEVVYFFLRPDRAWLLLCVISLLLCLCLSLVYTRLLALERLAEQLSSTSTSGLLFSAHSRSTDLFGSQLPPFNEQSYSRLRVMKEMTANMAQTLTQMQHVLTKVQMSLDLLHNTYVTTENIHFSIPPSTPPHHTSHEPPPIMDPPVHS